MMIRSVLPFGGLMLLIIAYAGIVDGAAVMSVDLGSEWMKVGVVSPGVPMEIALNKESKRKTPVVIAYRDGIRTFGEDAQSTGVRFPANAYFYLLDLLGKTVDNPIVELYKRRFPYYEIVGDEKRNTVVFKNGDERFSVEELVAQILMKAREFAQDFTAQQITECVIVVPGFFGQAERQALLASAQLANIKVLQLINDYTAVALNYGVFRRTEINDTAQYYVFYDMGAQKTEAAVVSYQLVKDKVTKETNPVIQILGVGYDRTLGGLEVQLRLRDYLAAAFNQLKKTETDVFTNPRAMAKLFKEAGRVKNVLSANADHYAQIENLIEEQDFKMQVTREKLEDICADLWPRVTGPLQQALQTAGLSLDVINQVILFGGGTRVPKVQEILRDYIKQELGKNLNADEAAAMGAVYKAADLATGFKVKKFIIKDAVIFPIQVVFERDPGDGSSVKQIKRILFGQMNSYPQKKVITFNKHTENFDFYVNYADLSYLSPEEILNVGSVNISHIELSNVREILEKNKGEDVESKGIKAHFSLDDSGIFKLSGVDFVFEKKKTQIDEPDESTLSKLGSTISKLFSGDAKKEEKEDAKNEKAENETKTEDSPKGNQTEEKVNATKADSKDASKNDTVKIVTVKEPVDHKLTYLYASPLAGDAYEESFKKIEELNQADRERTRKESAFNALESFVIDTQEKLSTEEYASCATENEISKIIEECSNVSEWLYEGGQEADAPEIEKRLNHLQRLTNEVYAKHWEHTERPEALEALNEMLDHAKKFLKNAQNLTKEANPDKDIFTQIEIDTLKKMIDDTIEWQKTEVAAQGKLKRYETVRLTIKDISDKIGSVDREVKYLLNKVKIWRPKKVPKAEKKEDVNSTTTNKTETEGETVEEKVNEVPTEKADEKQKEEVLVEVEEDVQDNDAEREAETEAPHGEL